MNAVEKAIGVSKADIIDAIYASPEGHLATTILQETVLKSKGFTLKSEDGSPRDIDYSLSWQLRDMITSGMIGWDYDGCFIVTASLDQLRDHYPPAKEPGFRLVPWKPTA